MLSSLSGGVARAGAAGAFSSSPLPKNCIAGAAWGFDALSSANTISGIGTAGFSGAASGSFSASGFAAMTGTAGVLFSGFAGFTGWGGSSSCGGSFAPNSMALSACISRSSYCSCGVRSSYWTAFFRGAACFSAGFFSGLGAGGSGALMGPAGFWSFSGSGWGALTSSAGFGCSGFGSATSSSSARTSSRSEGSSGSSPPSCISPVRLSSGVPPSCCSPFSRRNSRPSRLLGFSSFSSSRRVISSGTWATLVVKKVRNFSSRASSSSCVISFRSSSFGILIFPPLFRSARASSALCGALALDLIQDDACGH